MGFGIGTEEVIVFSRKRVCAHPLQELTESQSTYLTRVAAAEAFVREIKKLGVTHYGEWMILPEGINRILVYPEDKRRAAFREFLHCGISW